MQLSIFFSQDTLAYDDVSSDQVWLPRNQNKVESHILIIWALAVTLTMKTATTTNFSAWYSGSWCFFAIPNLVTKCSVIQKISSRQIFTDILNLRCDLDLKQSNLIFKQEFCFEPSQPLGVTSGFFQLDSPVYDAGNVMTLLNQVWLQRPAV